MTEYHASEFPPEDENGPFTSRGWDGEIAILFSQDTGRTYRVDHSDGE